MWSPTLALAQGSALAAAVRDPSEPPARRTAAHASSRHLWPAVGAAFVITALEDRRLNAFTMSHHTKSLDAVARAADPFGRAGILVPTLAVSVIAPRIVGERQLSDAMFRVA